MSQNMFLFADALGPLKIIHVHEPSVDLKAVLVIDNVAKGPSIGGVRMAERMFPYQVIKPKLTIVLGIRKLFAITTLDL